MTKKRISISKSVNPKMEKERKVYARGVAKFNQLQNQIEVCKDFNQREILIKRWKDKDLELQKSPFYKEKK